MISADSIRYKVPFLFLKRFNLQEVKGSSEPPNRFLKLLAPFATPCILPISSENTSTILSHSPSGRLLRMIPCVLLNDISLCLIPQHLQYLIIALPLFLHLDP